MMKITNKIYRFFILCFLVVFNSCETTQLEILDDPDAVSLEQSNIDFFMNSIQVNTATFFESVTEEGMETTRILHMFGPLYSNAYTPTNFNFPWSLAYSDIISDIRSMTVKAEAEGAYTHIGAAQIIEAYVIATLVDYFGDVPYSESNDGVTFNPKRDSGAEIYAVLQTLLDDAITNMNKTELVNLTSDIFYKGDKASWIRLANTLKLKLFLQTRLVNAAESTAGINTIIAGGNYITDNSQDFQFQYSTTDTNPDSRHPIFIRNFDSGGSITDYMSNYYMNELNAGFNDKTVKDPRLRYYIYKQLNRNAMSTVEQDCFGGLRPDWYSFLEPYCALDAFPGYWGRDHGDSGGIPPDTGSRATWGLYPIGGLFDDDSFTSIASRSIGTQGAGISPIMLASYVDFMLAEAALTLGTTGDAATYLMNGMEKSIDKVMNFRVDLVDTNFAPTAGDVNDYVDQVMTSYTAADNDGKLDVIVTEYFLALFGNGVEAYNTFRRTGKPANVQPSQRENTDMFLRSFFYPTVYINANANPDAEQKPDVHQRVFWDTNPDNGFIN